MWRLVKVSHRGPISFMNYAYAVGWLHVDKFVINYLLHSFLYFLQNNFFSTLKRSLIFNWSCHINLFVLL